MIKEYCVLTIRNKLIAIIFMVNLLLGNIKLIANLTNYLFQYTNTSCHKNSSLLTFLDNNIPSFRIKNSENFTNFELKPVLYVITLLDLF